MTSGTIGLVSRERPNYDLRIRLMASRTEGIRSVIERFVRQRHMHEVVRKPSEGVMTIIALARCDEVPRILAHRSRTIMAGRART